MFVFPAKSSFYFLGYLTVAKILQPRLPGFPAPIVVARGRIVNGAAGTGAARAAARMIYALCPVFQRIGQTSNGNSRTIIHRHLTLP